MAKTDANPPMPEFATSYQLQEVDPAWLNSSVKPKQFLHIDQAECILCEGCVDICPWYCIFMLTPDIVSESGSDEIARDMHDNDILFVIDDDACTRCNLCVERCPTGALTMGRLEAQKGGGARALGTVAGEQRTD